MIFYAGKKIIIVSPIKPTFAVISRGLTLLLQLLDVCLFKILKCSIWKYLVKSISTSSPSKTKNKNLKKPVITLVVRRMDSNTRDRYTKKDRLFKRFCIRNANLMASSKGSQLGVCIPPLGVQENNISKDNNLKNAKWFKNF